MSVLQHPLWPVLREYIRIETYDRDGGHAHPRHRIEVAQPEDDAVRRQLLTMMMPCVRCGVITNPVRLRKRWGRWFFSCTCRLVVRMGCARSKEARDEYAAVIADVLRHRAVPS